MAEHAEQIEAKLCAYVEGELSGPERAEIAAHLQANPEHATLIQDLIEQRRLLGQLPREKAPLDLTEELQAQLEREVLLGGANVAEESEPVLKISHWPQILSIAAIFLLAAGLGLVVYLVLPGNPTLVSTAQKMDEVPERAQAVMVNPAQAPDALGQAPRSPAREEPAPRYPTRTLAKAIGPEKPAAAPLATAKVAAPAAALPSPSPSTAKPPEALLAQSAGEVFLITVVAENTTLANADAVKYLASKGIPYSEKAQEELGRQLLDQLAFSVATPRGQVLQGALGRMGQGPVDPQEATVEATATAAAPADEPGRALARARGNRMDSGVFAQLQPRDSLPAEALAAGGAMEGKLAPEALAAPASQPAGALASVAVPARQGGAEGVGAELGGHASGAAPVRNGLVENRTNIHRVILASHMDLRQVNELAQVLSNPQRKQFAAVRREVALPLGPAPAAPALSSVEDLRHMRLMDVEAGGEDAEADRFRLLPTEVSLLKRELAALQREARAAQAGRWTLPAGGAQSDLLAVPGVAGGGPTERPYLCVIVLQGSADGQEPPATQPAAQDAPPVPSPASQPAN